MTVYQLLPNFFSIDPTKGTELKTSRYSIVRTVQIGGNYKNFHDALVVLWGEYKVLGQNIHPCKRAKCCFHFGLYALFIERILIFSAY